MTAQQSFYSHIDCKLAQANKQRNKIVHQAGSNIVSTKYYAGSYEKEIMGSNSVKEYDYIYTPEGLGAIVTKTGGSYSISYVHTDHLGSLRVISNGTKAVLARYSYDAWGKRTLVAGANITNRGFTGHEHIDEFGLINMNARLYDPTLGRFISIDPYVQMPDFSQSFNRYSYALNNPLSFTDPTGENPLLIALGIYVLFFTDFGYDVQKAISPVAVKVDLRFGPNQGGIGVDVSVGVPQALPLSYRVHGGATYYWKNEDMLGNNMSGWETRYGAEWGISGAMFDVPLTFTYGGTTFNSSWSGEQTTNRYMLGNPLVNAKYENDMRPEKGLRKHIPFVPKGDGDRYRTAAAQLNVGPFGVGINLITGDAGPKRNDEGNYEIDANGNKIYLQNDGYDPDQYRMGVLYFRAGPFRFGRNSEKVRHVFQNRFAHDFMTGGETKWFRVLDLQPRWWWQFGYSGGGTLW